MDQGDSQQYQEQPATQKFHQSDTNINDTILLNTFLIHKKKYRVLLDQKFLIWEKEKTKNEHTTIPLADILTVRLTNSSRTIVNQTLDSHNNELTASSGFTTTIADSYSSPLKLFLHVHYVKRSDDHSRDHNRWRKYTLKLYNTESIVTHRWYDVLTNILSRQQRPKNILLFINPFGGKRKALKIFEKYSKPLFELVNIEVNCLISQRANQIFDILMSMSSLDQYDAVCCVGGDGTVAELFNGLIRRSIRDRNLDQQRPAYLPKPRIPIGIIPAGSTDTIAYCLHGTTDIRTAVIHIILGQTRGMDLSSVCNDAGLVRLYASLMCYGYLGDIALDSEQFRWMGPRRYDYSGLKKFLANSGYEIELTIEHGEDAANNRDKIDSNGKSLITCNINCERCFNSRPATAIEQTHIIDYTILPGNSIVVDGTVSESANSMSAAEKEVRSAEGNLPSIWKTINGKYFMVAGANISCASTRSPNGLMPYCHLGDGQIDIIVVRHTNLFNLLRLLKRLTKDDPNIETLPFVEVYRTKRLIVKARGSSKIGTSSNCDLASMSSSRLPITETENPGNNTNNKKTSQWNCDGEILYETDVLISSHRQLVDVFMRGSYPQPEVLKSKYCSYCGC